MNVSRTYLPLSTSLLLVVMAAANAAPDEINTGDINASDNDLWSMCSNPQSVFKRTVTLPQFDQPEQIDISAETVLSASKGLSEFRDNVLIEKNNFRLQTQLLSYDQAHGLFMLPQPLQIDSDNISFSSVRGQMDNNAKTSEFNDVRFTVRDSHIQGSSPRLFIESDQRTVFDRVTFSSCEPGNEQWTFSASDLNLDHSTDTGSAHHVVLRVLDVPIFYLPYISFPLGEHRRSGVLFPELVFGSSRNGDVFSLPYYWNIAPNQDMLITPVYLEKRGTQLKTDYRYLTKTSNGELNLEHLANDRVSGEDRYLTKFNHRTQFTPQLNLVIDSSGASDSDYMTDFGQSLSVSSISHLQQSATLNFQSGGWRSKLLTQYYQTTDDAIVLSDRPYRRQPQLSVNGSEALGPLRLSLNAEWVQFEHQSTTRPRGSRSDFYPNISWPLRHSGWFFKPTLGQRFTAYEMTDGADTPLAINDRNTSVFQLDSGLFLERQLSSSKTQTLEPRLYYLNAEYADQSDIPLFDTSEPDFSFAQLFRDNRFYGADRMADANQLTTALTTRLLDNTNGNEELVLSLGQIHYFDDREVSLYETAGDTESRKRSDLAAEMILRGTHWSYRMSALQNSNTNELDRGSFHYQYRRNNQHIVNLGYRYRRDELVSVNQIEQSDISLKWPLSQRWSALLRWNYSLQDERDLENIVGLEYNDCCWAFRVVGRGHLTEDESGQPIFDRAVMFSLILKGFGSTGKANQELERAILGFYPEY